MRFCPEKACVIGKACVILYNMRRRYGKSLFRKAFIVLKYICINIPFTALINGLLDNAYDGNIEDVEEDVVFDNDIPVGNAAQVREIFVNLFRE